MWLAPFDYYRQSLPQALAERFFLLLIVLPWLVLLGRAGGPRSHWTTLGRWVLIAILMDRLMADHVLWLPLGVGLAAIWAACSYLERGLSSAVLSATAPARLGWLAAGAGVALAAAGWRSSQAVAFLVLLFVVMACYRPAAGAAAAPVARGDQADRPRRLVRAALGAGAAGVVLMGAVQGLSDRNFIYLLTGGIVGWTGLQFDAWRRRQGLARGRPARGRGLSLAAAMVCGVLAAVLLGEVYFRWIYDASDSNGTLRTSQRWARRHVAFNRWGYRDREFPEPDGPVEGLRVLLLGDSFAFGWGIDDDADRLGPVLERELQRRLSPAASVFTVAVGGANTLRETDLFEKDGRRLRPRAVVLAYHINDIDGPNFRVPRPGPLLLMWHPLLASSDCLEFLVWRVFERTHFGRSPQDRSSIMDYHDDTIFSRQAEYVVTLLRLVREAGAEPVAVLYPFLEMPTEAGPQRFALDRIAGLFAAAGVPVLDVSRLVDVSDRRFHANRFDPHPSAALHRAVAAPLAEKVVRALDAPATRVAATAQAP